uniref:Transthyretin-like family protein n=1 Tax=Caenorhabditis tropicalis TaxID=1561998 RepID=A0A1I7U2D6_9PELO
MTSTTLIISLLLLSQFADAVLNVVGSTQTISVTGRLVCQGQPARNVLVKMYEDGTIWDSKLDSTKTSNDGTFRVSGSYTKIFTLDPKVNIYHKCNYNGLCSKKLTINIPDYAVASGSGSSTNYDIGTLNLANQFSGETTDCIH